MLRTGFDLLDIRSAGLLEGRLNLLLADKPFGKTYFIVKVVEVALEGGWLVHYFDLDTFFTAYLRINLFNLPPSENLRVYNPDVDTLDRYMSLVCSTISERPQLVVLDSIPAFYHMLAGRSKPSDVNWRVGLYIAILMQHIRAGRGAILAASLLRSKKIKEELWVPSYPGGALVKLKSSLIYELKDKGEVMELRIIKHERKDVEGLKCSLPITF